MRLSIIILIALMTSSCAGVRMNKGIKAHSKYLEDVAYGNLSSEDKLEALALDMIAMLNESLDFKKARHSHKFITTYLDKNEASMNAIYSEFNNWYKALSIFEKGEVISRQVQKPYVKELRQVIPKMEKKLNRKIKSYQRIYRFFEIFIPFL